MSFHQIWKRKSLERFYRRMGVIVDDEQLVPPRVHVLVTSWSITLCIPMRHAGCVEVIGQGSEPWCQLWLKAIEMGDVLHVKSNASGAFNCTRCDELLFQWLKERGL
jgi:hypothetical protein